jgi:hypothetical protein
VWAWTFERFGFLAHGCRPVSITPHLTRGGWRVVTDRSAVRLGLPVRYMVSEKLAKAA